jgi:histidinol-phosphatase (PHP family)
MSRRDRQGRDLPLDAHLHTDRSPDSDVAIDEYARQAVARGIAEIAITDHVDFDPTAPAYAFATFAEREREIRGAAERWAEQGLAIRFGVEVTWDRRWADDIADHLRRHAYDFVIGSVHVYRDSVYASSSVSTWVEGRTLAEIVAPYFDEVEAGVRSGMFDAFGHLDFVKRYLAPHVTGADLAAAPELYDRLLTGLVDTGTALEINTSGLRQAPEETYPSPAMVARYRAMGGRAVTVGSDAHRADTFAWGLEDGYAAAAAAGFEALTFRRGGERIELPLGSRPNASVGYSL